jgi:hypothetical protein
MAIFMCVFPLYLAFLFLIPSSTIRGSTIVWPCIFGLIKIHSFIQRQLLRPMANFLADGKLDLREAATLVRDFNAGVMESAMRRSAYATHPVRAARHYREVSSILVDGPSNLYLS